MYWYLGSSSGSSSGSSTCTTDYLKCYSFYNESSTNSTSNISGYSNYIQYFDDDNSCARPSCTSEIEFRFITELTGTAYKIYVPALGALRTYLSPNSITFISSDVRTFGVGERYTQPEYTQPEIASNNKPQPDPEKEIFKQKAEQRAKALLLEYLDDENKKRYKELKPIEISSKIFTDIKYNIPISKTERIKALKDGKIVDRLCLTVRESDLPLEDIILTKILHALFNEEEMIRIANHSPHDDNLLTMLN